MYADTGLLYPNFPQEAHHFQLEELCLPHHSHSSMSSTIGDYDLGGDGDLFKAPEPIIEEPLLSLDPMLDPMTIAISMMSCGEDLKMGGLEPLQDNQLFSTVSYECKKGISGNAHIYETQTEEKLITEPVFQKSVSSDCLSSMDWVSANAMAPSFLDFPELDFEDAYTYGMRRAFSEGDIKALGHTNVSLSQALVQRPPVIRSCSFEDRLQKLSRYRNKKSKRNFGRKIKYACRKALADSQPRIRGRFAKTEETDLSKRQCLEQV